MQKNLTIRFVSDEGGVSLFVNGFLVFSPEDTGRSVTQPLPFIRKGVNAVELVPTEPGKVASFSIVNAIEGEDEEDDILLSLTTEQDGDGLPVIGEFSLEAFVLDFQWHQAKEIELTKTAEDEIYEVVRNLGKHLQNGPDDNLLKLLEVKHNEIAASVGLSKQDMDSGLLGGLAVLRDMPGFAVDVVERDDFSLITSSNGVVINARRKSGGHALKMMDGFDNPGFTVSLAKVKNRWVILR